MTEKFDKRQEAILDMCNSYAYKEKGYYLVSFWDLAHHLNNCWKSKLFVDKDKCAIGTEHYDFWAIKSYDTYKLRRPINWTIRKMKGKVIQQNYCTFYKIKIRR